jgi:hypothetical protein
MTANTPKQLEQVLTQLKDIHYPETSSFWPLNEALWWPPAPGRILLSLIILFFLVFTLTKCFKKLKQYYKHRHIQLALSELTYIEQNLTNSDPIITIQKITTLMKKCALVKNKALGVQSLSGHAWLKFLNESGNTNEFTSSYGLLMITLPYVNNLNSVSLQNDKLELDLKKLITSCKKWIRYNL